MRFLLLHFTNCANLIAHLALARAQTVLQIVIFFGLNHPLAQPLSRHPLYLFVTRGRAGEEPGNEVGKLYSELNIFTSQEHPHTKPNGPKCIRYGRISPRLCKSIYQERICSRPSLRGQVLGKNCQRGCRDLNLTRTGLIIKQNAL